MTVLPNTLRIPIIMNMLVQCKRFYYWVSFFTAQMKQMTTLPALRDKHPQHFGSCGEGIIGILYIYKKQVEEEERNSDK